MYHGDMSLGIRNLEASSLQRQDYYGYTWLEDVYQITCVLLQVSRAVK